VIKYGDDDVDGLQDATESGIAGAKIEIVYSNGNAAKDINGTEIQPFTTSSDGKYQFCNLKPDTYKLKVTPPDGYRISPNGVGSDSNIDSDITPDSNTTDPITLISADNNNTFDAGVFKPACIGDKVWLDKNANGIQDSDEGGSCRS